MTWPVTMKSIEATWEALEAAGELGGAQRVDDVHPCDLYGALDAAGHRGLVLLTDRVPPNPPHLESVLVTTSVRNDGRFSLGFWLQTPALGVPFAHLCEDLVEESREVSPDYAAGFLLSRLARWRRLLRGETSLSLQRLRGIVGELLVLRHCMRIWPPTVVVEGWLGPLEAPQDFVLPGLRIESKAIVPDARVVRISSADQLDVVGRLHLAVASLITGNAEGAGMTVSDLAGEIREHLWSAGAHGTVNLFEGRLAATGLSDPKAHDDVHFTLESLRFFNVGDGFPAIRRPDLPAGVAEIRYDIELAACLPHLVELTDQ